ncbi:MAG: protein kinase [Calditrichia bacterium]|nr:protein kinase [Calditrichia bacterium]
MKSSAKAAAALNHYIFSHIYAIEEEYDEIFIVMEYIGDKELKKIVGAHHDAPISIDKCISIATQIAEGLQAARRECPPREGFLLEKGGAFLPLDLILYTTAPITEDLPV